MSTTGIGAGAAHALSRRCARLRRFGRRVLTLFGLVLGFWLVGLALHAGTAGATPSSPPDPAGVTAALRHPADAVGTVGSVGAVGTVVHRVSAHGTASSPDQSGTAHAAHGTRAAHTQHSRDAHSARSTASTPHRGGPSLARSVRHVAVTAVDVVSHAATVPVRTTADVLGGVVGHVRQVVHLVVHHVVRPVTDPIVAPALANYVANHVANLDTATPTEAGTAPGAGLPGAGSVVAVSTPRPALLAAAPPVAAAPRVGLDVAPPSWSLDTAPPSPHAPQPLPYSPGGNVAAGGSVPSGHESGATLPDRAAARRVSDHRSVVPADAVSTSTDEKRPGFSPD